MGSEKGSFIRRLLPSGAKARVRNMLDDTRDEANPKVFANGGVVLWDDFLPKNDFIGLQRWANEMTCEFTRSDRNWQELLIRDFNECLGSRQWCSLSDDVPEPVKPFIEAVQKTGLVEPDAEIHLGVYRWLPKSGMGEHSDSHTDTAITFYLNDTWKDDWFGDFVFYESEEGERKGIGRAVAPKENRLVINRATVHHKVTYTSENAVDRLTLQAFLPKPEDGHR